jgi:hypothetical protein
MIRGSLGGWKTVGLNRVLGLDGLSLMFNDARWKFRYKPRILQASFLEPARGTSPFYNPLYC